MRDVHSDQVAAWRSGDYTGAWKPTCRATVQLTQMRYFRRGINKFASIVFNNTSTPVELPNVLSFNWDRSIDQDVANATLVLANVKPLTVAGVDSAPYSVAEMGLPGYYTFQVGSPLWGRRDNVYAQLLVPDNICRTYEGYGSDFGVCPDSDPHMTPSGVWRIDDVDITTDGLITVQMRDIGSLLLDHVVYKPVIPDDHYPLYFDAVDTAPGFAPPTVVANVGFDEQIPEGWEGPITEPDNFVITFSGDRQVGLEWDALPPTPEPDPLPAPDQDADFYRAPSGYYVNFNDDDTWYACSGPGQVNAARYLWGQFTNVDNSFIGTVAGTLEERFGGPSELEQYIPQYSVVQYKVYIDGVLTGISLDEDDLSTIVTTPVLLNGNVYAFAVAAVWQHFESGVKVTGQRAAFQLGRPNANVADLPHVDLASLNPTGIDGEVEWTYDDPGGTTNFHLFFFRGDPGEDNYVEHGYDTPATGGAGTFTFPESASLTSWNILVFGYTGALGVVGSPRGAGDLLLASGGEARFFRPPLEAHPLEPDPSPQGPQTPTSDPDQVIPRDTVPVTITYTSDSNEEPVPGHGGVMAADLVGDDWWQSDQQGSATSVVWWQGRLANQRIVMVRVFIWFGPYQVFISVRNNNGWVSYDPSWIVGDGAGGSIPYLISHSTAPDQQGPFDFYFREPIAHTEAIRITLTNLRMLGPGDFAGGLRIVEPRVAHPGSENEVTAADLIEEAHVVEGGGAVPHTYYDFTDIVLLICAWCAWFWPQDGTITDCNGDETEHNFGAAPYNLGDNIDPVLGAGSGRVWGDFEVSGTSGVARLTVQQFDKRPLMDVISHLREILGFTFQIDEDGGVVWRSLNIFELGNYVSNRTGSPGRTNEMVVLDDMVNIMDMQVALSGRQLRDYVYVADTTGEFGALVRPELPTNASLRRASGWTDVHFKSDLECQVMAEMIAIRQRMTFRTNRITIPGFPRLQVGDQVRVRERITGEDFVHLVSAISSRLDHASGEWIYTVETHWLGDRPDGDIWAVPALSPALTAQVDARRAHRPWGALGAMR